MTIPTKVSQPIDIKNFFKKKAGGPSGVNRLNQIAQLPHRTVGKILTELRKPKNQTGVKNVKSQA